MPEDKVDEATPGGEVGRPTEKVSEPLALFLWERTGEDIRIRGGCLGLKPDEYLSEKSEVVGKDGHREVVLISFELRSSEGTDQPRSKPL